MLGYVSLFGPDSFSSTLHYKPLLILNRCRTLSKATVIGRSLNSSQAPVLIVVGLVVLMVVMAGVAITLSREADGSAGGQAVGDEAAPNAAPAVPDRAAGTSDPVAAIAPNPASELPDFLKFMEALQQGPSASGEKPADLNP